MIDQSRPLQREIHGIWTALNKVCSKSIRLGLVPEYVDRKAHPTPAPDSVLFLAHNLHLNNRLGLKQHVDDARHHLRLHILQN
jgi:hypothetical protein